MQARIIITAAFAAFALAVPAANAAMQDVGGAGSDSAATHYTPAALDALGQRGQAAAGYYSSTTAVRPDDRAGALGAGTIAADAGAVRPDDRAGALGPGTNVDDTPAPAATPAADSRIDWRELGFSGAAALSLFALVVTRLHARHADRSVTKPATLSS